MVKLKTENDCHIFEVNNLLPYTNKIKEKI